MNNSKTCNENNETEDIPTRISVVILNWNGANLLRKFLPSVISNSQGEGIEVCVADNGSTDESMELIQKDFPSVRLIPLHQNYGFASGYNVALQEINATYVVLLNSDVEVTEHWLEPLVKYMDEHPGTAACQPKIRSYRHKECFEYAGGAGGFIDRYGYPYCRGRIFGKVEVDKGQYDDIVPILWASGAALFVRLADFNRVGGFDTRFFAHMEEIDLCWRMKTAGLQIVCIPQSTVYHVGAATLKVESPNKTFLNFRNNLATLYKNLPAQELSHVMFVRHWLDKLAWLHFILTGKFAHASAIRSAHYEFRRMRPEYLHERDMNVRNGLTHPVPERTKISLLWQYYIRGKKKFSSL